jgi:hypothetical protein
MIKPGTVSVAEVAKESVRVYPNPAKDVLKIAVDKTNSSPVSVTVYNIVGSKMYASTLKVQNGEATVPVTQLAPGTYIYEVTIGEASYKGRFIKE